MDAIRISKPNMSVLRQSPAALSPFGIPELIPGRYINIRGLDGENNGTYFMSKVRHVFTRDGFYTKFEVKGAKT